MTLVCNYLERYRYETMRRKWKSRGRARRDAAWESLLSYRYGGMKTIQSALGTAQTLWRSVTGRLYRQGDGTIMKPLIPLAFALLGATSLQASETLTVTLEQASEKGTGASVGTVTISQSPYGLVFTPDLQGLEPGIHGFHVHTEANCAAAEVDGKLTPAGAA